jgi:hypothetical protein
MEEREHPPRPKTLNRESQRPSRLLTAGLALLTLSGLYLLGPARAALGWDAALAVLLHIGLGLLLIVPLVIVGVRTLRTRLHHERRSLFWSAFGLSAVTGLVLTLRAAGGISTASARGIWWAHVATGLLAALFWGGRLLRARRRRTRPEQSPAAETAPPETSASETSSVGRSLCRATLPRPPFASRLWLLLLTMGTLGLGGTALLPRYDAAAYYRDTTATNAAQAENPLFPAGVRLAAGSRHTAPEAGYCGRDGCHAGALEAWHGGGHQQAATDPVYRRVRDAYAAQAGATAAQWCAGCHEPLRAVQNAGVAYAATTGADPSAATGVDCVACHAMTDVSARTGNGRFTLFLPQNTPFADRSTGWRRGLHDFLVRVRPAPHQAAYLKPEIHTSSEFCGTCHRQSFNVAQNGYQFVHGMDTWGTWQSGPFSGRAARTAGLKTEAPRTCQECHFTRRSDGTFSHADPNAMALPWQATLSQAKGAARTDAKRRHGTSIDIFALRRVKAAGQPEEWIAPLDAPGAGTALRAGETCLLDIVVSNRAGAHEFPTGYTDIQEAWLEVTLRDGKGRLLAESGKVGSGAGALPADTHAYRSIPLDREGKAITRHDLWRQVTTAYHRTIPSGGADIARYRLTVPRAFTPPLTVQARLRFRSLRPDFAKWVGLPGDVPVTTLAEAKVALPLPGASAQARPETETASRFVEYGVGLLAPKDAPDAARARRAFLTAQRLAPNRPEAFVGLGRAYLVEPELLAARAQFTAALRLAPDDPAAQADLGVVYSKQGEYDRALDLLRPLALRFPQDGALQFDLGLTLFRSGNYQAAVLAFENSLAADPDNAAAHFQLKQCFQHLQRVPEARREEALGQYLAEDHLLPLLVPPYLRAHPDLQQAAQPIPEHRLRPEPR